MMCNEEVQLVSATRTEAVKYSTHFSVIHHTMRLSCSKDFFFRCPVWKTSKDLCLNVCFPYSKIMTPVYLLERQESLQHFMLFKQGQRCYCRLFWNRNLSLSTDLIIWIWQTFFLILWQRVMTLNTACFIVLNKMILYRSHEETPSSFLDDSKWLRKYEENNNGLWGKSEIQENTFKTWCVIVRE